jgi:methyl-accepting chemotaxis protein
VIDGGIRHIASQPIDQSSILKQLNLAIGELDQVTQSNAAIAEESTAASQSLAEATERLDALVSEFRLQSALPAADRVAKMARSHPALVGAAA